MALYSAKSITELNFRAIRRRAARAVSPAVAAFALAAATAVLAGPLAAQVPTPLPQRPAGVSDQQVQQAIQQRGLGDQIRQRIQQSGLTPDQIRARLRSAGYSENLVDAYLAPAQPGQAAPTPTLEVLRAATTLGFADFVLADTTQILRDSLRLDRGDSLLLDSLGLDPAIDSIPSQRDSLGVIRLDTVATLRLADRLRRPRVFGLDVFRRTTNQFAPVAAGPVDAGYRIGAGDELVLILSGDVEAAHALSVARDGYVVVPQVGQLFVANLTLGQLKELLTARVGRVYASVRPPNPTTRLDVTVSRLRVNQVFVVGEVARPGAYGVSAAGTVMNALYQAGGLNERGDFRAVRVMRGGRAVQTLDLYDYLLRGDVRSDVRLEQGDVVFIPPAARRVLVTGSVVRPALYDLAEGETLSDLIAMAGGLQADARVDRVQVDRILPPAERRAGGRDRTQVDLDLRADSAAVLAPGDRVTVYAVTRAVRDRVVIRGNVWRPGPYQRAAGMRLSTLIAEAGGLKPDTYGGRAHILRLLPDSTRQLIAADLSAVAPQGAPGPAGAPAGAVAGAPQPDPELMEFDEVTVYSRTEFRPQRQITVFGEVQRPGVFPFRDSMTLRDAVIIAGGLRDNAYLMEAQVSRLPEARQGDALAVSLTVPMDSSYVLDLTGYLRRPVGQRAPEAYLHPYDNIFIRRVPGWELQRNVVIVGEVRFPGRYTLLRRDEHLRSVIERAGGLTPEAYVGGLQLVRSDARTGRIGIDLERVMRDSTYRDNLILLAGDSLYVPQFQSVVRVDGAVNSPVAVAWVPNRNAGWYVDRAGGFARRADKRRTYVVQPNGGVERRSAAVLPGARVVVPEIPPGEERTNWLAIIGGITSILTSTLTIIVVAQRL